MSKLRTLLKAPNKRMLLSAMWRSFRKTKKLQRPVEDNLKAIYSWICAAQDATPDGGVAGRYSLLNGWSSSYPETTGYIIPSMLAYGAVSKCRGARARALRMADWEIEVQLPCGAVQSGSLGEKVGPAVFNTGQVILGWTSVYRETGDSRYADAVRMAACWLLRVQDEDGAWRKHLSLRTSSSVQTYNTRTAWAFAQAGMVLGESEWIDAARRNLNWSLTQQDESGWFRNNVFDPREEPLTHTICYAIEGLLGAGLMLSERRYIEAAQRGTDGLAEQIRKQGRIHGRYGAGWHPMASWRCLTGDAQLAGILLRLCKHGLGKEMYKDLAESIVNDLCCLQGVNPNEAGVYGGVAGPQPIWKGYSRLGYPNWAAKFHLDALLLALHGVDPHAVS